MDRVREAFEEMEADTILMVGFVCYDLIFNATHYPVEDSMATALGYHKRRGGNASNSSTVLSQLGAKCELLAAMTSDENAKFIQEDLAKNSIAFHHSSVHPDYDTPFTSIILSQATGSRTIMHYRHSDFPENTVEDFAKLNLSAYKWIHFEGRSIPETLKMIDLVDAWNVNAKKAIKYSVELEKCSDRTKQLIPRGDIVFLAKEFAKFLGYNNPHSALNALSSLVKPGAIIIMPYGEQGAFARCCDGTIIESKAHSPRLIIDSTGAGDTFIAATTFYLSQGKSLQESIEFGNQIAGAKCGMMGYLGIKSVYDRIQKGCN